MELLANIVIRPSRVHYHLNELGPVSFVVGDTRVSRIDLAVKSKNGVVLAASHYVPEGVPVAEMPVIVYCHGNGSSRFEALGCLDNVLPLKMSLFCFDFSGAGLSGGENCSMGIRESRDVESVLDFLHKTGHRALGLWGRSAGAAASLLASSRRDALVDAVIVDSCFLSLEQVSREIAGGHIKSQMNITGLLGGQPESPHGPLLDPLADLAVIILRSSVLRSEEGFDIKEVDPASQCETLRCPIMFVAAEEDTVVRPHHTIELYGLAHNSAERKLVFVPGTHNSDRPDSHKEEAVHFLHRHLQNALQSNTLAIRSLRPQTNSPFRTPVRRSRSWESPSASQCSQGHALSSPENATSRRSTEYLKCEALPRRAALSLTSGNTAALKKSTCKTRPWAGKENVAVSSATPLPASLPATRSVPFLADETAPQQQANSQDWSFYLKRRDQLLYEQKRESAKRKEIDDLIYRDRKTPNKTTQHPVAAARARVSAIFSALQEQPAGTVKRNIVIPGLQSLVIVLFLAFSTLAFGWDAGSDESRLDKNPSSNADCWAGMVAEFLSKPLWQWGSRVDDQPNRSVTAFERMTGFHMKMASAKTRTTKAVQSTFPLNILSR